MDLEKAEGCGSIGDRIDSPACGYRLCFRFSFRGPRFMFYYQYAKC
jgi:hypothetical protein